MKIAVMAAGGVGGYFGANLAKAGHEISFIARGRHLDTICKDGLKVESPNGNIHLQSTVATDNPADIGPVDVVIFAVKLADMEPAAEACRPLLRDGTAVIPFLNGVDAPETLVRVLGPEYACGGVAYISALISAPGCIRQVGEFARLVFGEIDGRRSERLQAFETACADSGINHLYSDDIDVALWEKFSVLVPMSGITAGARCPIGPIRAEPLGRKVFKAAMAEVIAVGKAKGIALPDDLMERQLHFFNGLPDEMKASMLVDLEAGKALEAPWLSGAVTRMGREAGVATPVNDTLYAILQPHATGTLLP